MLNANWTKYPHNVNTLALIDKYTTYIDILSVFIFNNNSDTDEKLLDSILSICAIRIVPFCNENQAERACGAHKCTRRRKISVRLGISTWMCTCACVHICVLSLYSGCTDRFIDHTRRTQYDECVPVMSQPWATSKNSALGLDTLQQLS